MKLKEDLETINNNNNHLTQIPPSDVSLYDFIQKWKDYDEAQGISGLDGRVFQRLKIAKYQQITILPVETDTANQILAWLAHHLDAKNYAVATTPERTPVCVWFYTDADAALFRLAWSGYVSEAPA